MNTVINALLIALDAKDPASAAHCRNVALMTGRLTKHMVLPDTFSSLLQSAALFHDVGKIGIPDAVLNYPCSLNRPGMAIIRSHPDIGAQILLNGDIPDSIIACVRHHHEFWDGSGYPSGLSGQDIPLGARIIAVLDAIDAMCGQRCYRGAMPLSDCRGEILRLRGKWYDPQVVDTLMENWESVTDGLYP